MLCMGVLKENIILQSILQKGLNSVSQSDYDNLSNKWLESAIKKEAVLEQSNYKFWLLNWCFSLSIYHHLPSLRNHE